ncbi:unnamed protein product [Staurois parvus]|uniref:Uncharacterized protein n=1 Tax=Staurois parvus TaxID=386267 RepID=A0ABN9CM17_9NEOB|nr:unnamed protein product [Staurois parvus]
MPASVFWVPFPVKSGRTGDKTAGINTVKSHSITLLYQTISHNFVPSALSCALPAFLLFFLPGN